MLFTNPLATITGPRCCLPSAVSFTNLQVSITNTRGKNGQNGPKKGPKPKKVFACLYRYNGPTFNENKKSHFTIPLNAVYPQNIITRWVYLKILILLNGLRRFEPEAPGRRLSKGDSLELIVCCFLETGYGSNVSGNCHKLSFSSFISLQKIRLGHKNNPRIWDFLHSWCNLNWFLIHLFH